MPEYTYRREDGTTFSIRQKFSDDPLQVDPETGQKVVRLVQATGVIFKGSGFYVTDNKGGSAATTANSKADKAESNGNGESAKAEKTETSQTSTAKETTTTSSKSDSSSAAD